MKRVIDFAKIVCSKTNSKSYCLIPKFNIIHQVFGSICIPMVLGVAILLIVQYQYTQMVIENWKSLSEDSIMVFEKQKLYNYVSANKAIADIQFQDISSDIYVLSKFYNKVQSGQVKSNPNSLYQKCSMRDFQTSNLECPQHIQKEYSLNRNYVDLWFHRTAHIESQLNPIEKNLLQTNLVFITLAKGFYSVRKNSLLDEQWIYNTFNNSLMIGSPASTISLDFYYQDCMQGKYQEPYDPRCRPWYKQAMQNEGIQFEQPYVYAFDNSIGMTSSSKILDGNNQIQSVISIDFGITNLVNDVFSLQDQNDPSSIYEAYSVFFHKQNRTIFYHRYWNRSSGDLYNWADLEYNETSGYPKSESIDFSDQLTKAILQSNSVDNFYNFNQIQNSSLFLNFAKNDRNYTALVYPVEAYSVNQKLQIEMIQVMFIARVQRNIVDLILQDILKYNKLLEALAIVEICFVSIILIISLCHFTAVLMHQIATPLDQLTNFLKHSSLLIKQHKTNEIVQINNQLQIHQKQPQINQSLAFSTQLRFHQQTIFSQQLRDSFASNQALNCFPEYCKNKYLTIPQQIKDKSQFKYNSPSPNFQPFTLITRRFSNTDFKMDNQLYSLPTKNLDNDKAFSPKKKETQFAQKQRRLTENQQQNSNRNKETQLESSIKLIDYYNCQKMGDISQLKSQFKEFSVIKKTFKILANIIQFQREGFYASDNTESLLKFTKAYKIFNKIQNQQALALCLYNIGKLHSESRRYNEATESYQLSQQICLQQLGYNDVVSFQRALQQGNINNDQFYLNLLKNTCQNFGLLLKQQVQDSIISQQSINSVKRSAKKNIQTFDPNQTIQDYDYSNLQKEFIKIASLSLKLLQLTIDLENKSNPINKFNLQLTQTDIAELLVYLGDVSQSLIKINQVQDQLYYENNQASCNEEIQIQLQFKKENKIYSQQLNQLETNFLFIRGIIQMKRRQYFQAANLFTDMIENSISCDPQKKLLALSMIHICFFNAQLNTKSILKFLLKEQHIYFDSLLQSALLNRFQLPPLNSSAQDKQELCQIEQTSFDVSLIFQTPSFQSQIQKEFENYQLNFLDWLIKFFLQPQKDRLSILNCYEEDQEPFSSQIDTIQHLSVFYGDKTLKIIAQEYQRLYKEFQSKFKRAGLTQQYIFQISS
ncbi:tetratricopeptide repeat protein (macronuclear) [Tetrahymena thermophila SB210]|uniref:Tetratricopeptide repeat protein n=1 Tax=Tetrahymena thermophila (strain SB210) TaxID=312017 RepID=I7M199_TETTS|nr:tetratricopeptide repeat protein [Tetrahymena thermophila SB210]EAR95773.2 tetratricopeptide repeat protein [Tetrahymena thermophila SB210]|eukprot:XP_001016018.2 tetratricopeptide repeat protein [Tetrahymena thermophila SB210]